MRGLLTRKIYCTALSDIPASVWHKFLEPMYAITRYRAAVSAWCWQVHIRRRGRLHYRRFHDLKYGGRKRALAAAVAWRDRTLRTVKVLSLREFHEYKRSNNTSGVVGVHFLKPKRQPRGIWQARIRLPNGRKIHRSFSVAVFGTEGAFRRAVAARRRMLELIDERVYLRSKTAKRFVALSK